MVLHNRTASKGPKGADRCAREKTQLAQGHNTQLQGAAHVFYVNGIVQMEEPEGLGNTGQNPNWPRRNLR